MKLSTKGGDVVVNDAESRDRPLEEELEDLRILEGRRPFGGRSRRTRRILLWAVLLALLIGIGVAVWQFWPATKPVAVADIVVREGGAMSAAMTAAGYVTAEQMATVSARVIGRLVYMSLDVGDRVRAGQVIARLDNAEYRARLRRAEADRATARAALARLEAGSRPEEIWQAEARLASTQAVLEEAERNYRRTEELFRRELIAAADRDHKTAAGYKISEMVYPGHTPGLMLGKTRVEVVGIFEGASADADQLVIVPLALAQTLADAPEAVSLVTITLRSAADAEAVKKTLEAELKDKVDVRVRK